MTLERPSLTQNRGVHDMTHFLQGGDSRYNNGYILLSPQDILRSSLGVDCRSLSPPPFRRRAYGGILQAHGHPCGAARRLGGGPKEGRWRAVCRGNGCVASQVTRNYRRIYIYICTQYIYICITYMFNDFNGVFSHEGFLLYNDVCWWHQICLGCAGLARATSFYLSASVIPHELANFMQVV